MRWLRSGASHMLKQGPLPQHLAFIMDGNRRFADREAAGNVEQGHNKGFDKLLEALEWCLDLGVKCVTVYAFSIENFNRSSQEVAMLMSLAERKLHYLLNEAEVIGQHDLKIKVIGDLTLLPASLQVAAGKVMRATEDNHGPILNICFAYLSSQEMAAALASTAKQAGQKRSLEMALFTADCPPVDLLIRTSGECRLTDFMLWQSQHALLYFADVLWPSFSFRHFLRALVSYQTASRTRLKLCRQANDARRTDELLDESNQPSIREASISSAQLPAQILLSENLCRTEGVQSEPSTPLDQSSDMADSASDIHEASLTASKCKPDESRVRLVAEITADSRAVQRLAQLVVRPSSSQEDTSCLDESRPPGGNEATLKELATTAPVRRRGLQPKRVRSSTADLMSGREFEEGLFQKAPEPPASRAQQLKKNGIAGGYDSMESDEEDIAHVNGCPCCIVKFLPMHRICTDPTPAIRAIKES